jgi:hypothetical protein
MTRPMFGVLYLVCLIGGMCSTLLMIYYFFSMLGGAKPESKKLTPLFGPIGLFVPQLWNSEANMARKRTLLFAMLLAACIGGLTLIANISPP